MTKAPSVIYEMLRSFVSVADTLNISKAVKELGFTRQTIRRHLDDLEEISGGSLFEVYNRQYHLTEIGRERIEGARELVSCTDDWVKSQYISPTELKSTLFHSSDNLFIYYMQQHKLLDAWNSAMPLISATLAAWCKAEAKLESEAFSRLKDYLLIYRKSRDNWLCTFVGQKSSYVSWLGVTWAKSAVGKVIGDDEGDLHDHRFVIPAYEGVMNWGTPRYDHIHTAFSRNGSKEVEPVNYQRLLVPLYLPDGEPVLGVMVARTNKLDFMDLKVAEIPQISEEMLMEFSP